MIINNIELSDFRNISLMCMEADPHMNVIYGENAQGKTNLLEAIYLLSGSRSFRGAKDSELIRVGADKKKGACITAAFSTKYDSYCGKFKIKENRSAYLNDVPLKSVGELGDIFPAMVFSPRDLALVQNGPEERRKFLDQGLCQLRSLYGELIKNYRTALDQRAAILKNIRANMDWTINLDIWDSTLAALGAKIIYQRDQYLNRLSQYTMDFFQGLGGEKESLELKMIKTIGTDCIEKDQIESALMKGLEENREKDIACGFTTVGPHRDDLDFRINGMSVKGFGSQGQQRSVALAVKMGEAYVLEAVYEEAPVILLDDVMSELDQRRQNYIMNHIQKFQVFITCCDKNTVLRLREGKTFQIKDGALNE